MSEAQRLESTTHKTLGTVPEMDCRSNFYLPSTLFKHIHITFSGQPGAQGVTYPRYRYDSSGWQRNGVAEILGKAEY
jgi:hypothetical protein